MAIQGENGIIPEKIEISQQKIDRAIDKCIRLTRIGMELSPRQSGDFGVLFAVVAGEKKLKHHHHSSPLTILDEFQRLGLVKRPEHKEFIARHHRILRIEVSLIHLKHTFPDAFKGIASMLLHLPIEKKEKYIEQLGEVSKEITEITRLQSRIVILRHGKQKNHKLAEKEAMALDAKLNDQLAKIAEKVSVVVQTRPPAHHGAVAQIRNGLHKAGTRREQEFWLSALRHAQGGVPAQPHQLAAHPKKPIARRMH